MDAPVPGGAAPTRRYPLPACLHRSRSVPPPPSCWCATPRPPPERPPRPCSRSSWCGATSSRTSSAGPTCSPAGRSIWPTAGSEAEALCAGRSDAEASALLGFPSGGLAYWVAVVRETFEEAGLLLARREDGPALLAGDAGEEARLAAARLRVNDGSLRFLDLCREEGLRLSVDRIHYFAHWITPRGAPRRYDTRFFVAAAPPGQHAAHDAGETIAEVWITPERGAGPAPGRATSRSSSRPSATCRPSAASRPAPRCSTRRPRRRARCPPSSRGSSPTAPACASCCPAIPPTSAARWPTPATEARWATSTRPCAPCRCRPTSRDPTPHPGPDRRPDAGSPTARIAIAEARPEG